MNRNDHRAIQAFKRWADVFENGKITINEMERFAAFTGDPFEFSRGIIVNWKNDDVMKKIDIILGPHGHTMLKMWKAQQDASTDEK